MNADEPEEPVEHEPMPARKRISDLFHETLDAHGQVTIQFGVLVDSIRERGFGALFILVALPTLIPSPVGVGWLFGPLAAIVGAQMAWGAPYPWLPQRVRRAEMNTDSVRRFVKRIDPWLHRLERLCHPSWTAVTGVSGMRFHGFMAAMVGLALAAPVPFTNIPFASLLVGYGIATTEKDGRWMVVLWILSTVLCIGLIFFGGQMVDWGQQLWDWTRSHWN